MCGRFLYAVCKSKVGRRAISPPPVPDRVRDVLIPGQILLHAEVQDSTTVIPETATIVPRNTSVATSEPDTIAEKHGLSRKKYKRGLKNYLLIPQKQWIAGLTLSHGEFDSKTITS